MIHENADRLRILAVRQKEVKPSGDIIRRASAEWIAALRLQAEVQVIDTDFDYAEVCAASKPDLVVVEAPSHNRAALTVMAHPDACADVPRVAYFNVDPHDGSRLLFFEMLNRYRFDAVFSFDATQIAHCPELAGRAFVSNIFVDSDVFRDYGLEKIVPVSNFGGRMGRGVYCWRGELLDILPDYFPTLFYPHPGYDAPAPAHMYPVLKEDYARMLNRSRFSLADTTRFHYIVRKHLEIPACGAVLVAPDVQVLRDYGFVHMENCILGSGIGLLESMAAVAGNPALYEKIRKAGHDWVHARYTAARWTVFGDWLRCRRALTPGAYVRQKGACGPFFAAPLPSGGAAQGVLEHPGWADSEYTLALKTAQGSILENGDLDKVRQLLEGVAGWLGHLMEPHLLLGIVSLLQGNPRQAREEFLRPYWIRIQRDKIAAWDPVEVAWLILTFHLLGEADLASSLAGETASLRHLALRRVRWLIPRIGDDWASSPDEGVRGPSPEDRLSVHWMGQLPWDAWVLLHRRLLEAVGAGRRI